MALVEALVVAVTVLIAGFTFWAITRWFPAHQRDASRWIAPLLIANLLPAVTLVVLIGRRIALQRAGRAGAAANGRLHVRLVAIFSLLASIPIILTAIAASVMFQSGVQFWESDRARNAFESSIGLVRESQQIIISRWASEGRAMAGDLSTGMRQGLTAGTPSFHDYLGRQTLVRNLEQAVLLGYSDKGGIVVFDQFNPPSASEIASRLRPAILRGLKATDRAYVDLDANSVWVVTPLEGSDRLYLYVATSVNARFLSRQVKSANGLFNDYHALQARANDLQLKFNLALYAVALLIIAVTVWIALAVADRVVRPVDSLVEAAERVAEGDFTARVKPPRGDDEISTLARVFNAMTRRLEEQTNALVSVNEQLDQRRTLIETVLTGVSAGVIAVDREATIRLINRSALGLLRADEAASPVGEPLAALAPELAELLAGAKTDAVVQVNARGEPRTLAVRIAAADAGPILTFDDITQQLLDQRRAAWSDVARRIAHEIKNPLTPIQLAAERLQRRYGRRIAEDDGIFTQLTGTIVRQVGDLRRMVDEFSSFARMPKPMFRNESVLDIARQVLFLHEVAHGDIRFHLTCDGPPPMLVCDRRQIGQALTNVVKNAVEAIEAREGGEPGAITLCIVDGEQLGITVADNGVGLPLERDRIVEPYMTTRARGTGLGLAIVKKIVEEHLGTVRFDDRPEGGTIVTFTFDRAVLARLDGAAIIVEDDARAPVLTRVRD